MLTALDLHSSNRHSISGGSFIGQVHIRQAGRSLLMRSSSVALGSCNHETGKSLGPGHYRFARRLRRHGQCTDLGTDCVFYRITVGSLFRKSFTLSMSFIFIWAKTGVATRDGHHAHDMYAPRCFVSANRAGIRNKSTSPARLLLVLVPHSHSSSIMRLCAIDLPLTWAQGSRYQDRAETCFGSWSSSNQ